VATSVQIPTDEPIPANRAEVVAKTYAVEIAEWVREMGWDFRFFLGAMLWTNECYERGSLRGEVAP
jgi:hypothetical protein